MAERVEIVVTAKDTASQVLRGVTSSFGALGNMVQGMTSGRALEMLAEQMVNFGKEAVNATVSYANEVRELSLISGETTEETSRFIQVLDDYKISANDATVAAKALKNQGMVPTIETLAKLSDAYLAIQDPAERMNFIQENLGRGGAKWVEVLNKGSAALLEQASAIDKSLILTQEAVDNAREYELALDDWNDAVLGLKVSIGNELIPALTELISETARASAEEERWNKARIEGGNMSRASAGIEQRHNEIVEEASATADSATRSYTAYAQAMRTNTEEAVDNTEAIKAMSDANQDMLGLIMNLQGEYDNFTEKNGELTAKLAELTAEQEKFHEGSRKWKEYQEQIDETNGAINELAAEHERAGQRIAFSLLQAKLAADGFTNAEFEGLLRIGEQWGILDSEVVNAAMSMDASMEQIASGLQSVEFYGNGATRTNKRFTESEVAAASAGKGFNDQLTVMTDQLFVAKTLQGTYSYLFNIKTTGFIPDFSLLGGATGSSRRHGGQVVGFAEGTEGWKTVPPNYPNDSYPIGLSSGEKFAVIPAGGSMPSGTSSGGGLGMNVNINISSFLSLSDQRDAEYKLKPMIERIIRGAQGLI